MVDEWTRISKERSFIISRNYPCISLRRLTKARKYGAGYILKPTFNYTFNNYLYLKNPVIFLSRISTTFTVAEAKTLIEL
jgi:hypothetical protein